MMHKDMTHPHWAERYRPNTLDDVIMTKDLRKTFNSIRKAGSVRNMIFAGISGFGKTTIARALLKDMDIDYVFVNGSLQRNIDTLRNEIQDFAGTVSFNDNQKGVIIDEADYLNKVSTQPAMRSFLDEYSRNCCFILTCNFKEQLLGPLTTRFEVIDFKIPIDPKERADLAGQFMKRCEAILKEEGVEYDLRVVAHLITDYFPNWRQVLVYLQKYAQENENKIDSGILTKFKDIGIDRLVEMLKKRDFSGMRRWVGETYIEGPELYRKLYDKAEDLLTPEGAANMITIIGRYQFQAAFVADPQINTASCLTEIMGSCEFK